jgi:hypothetical protein
LSKLPGKSYAVVGNAQQTLALAYHLQPNLDGTGSIIRKGILHGVGDPFIDDESHRYRLSHIQLYRIKIQGKPDVLIGNEIF